MLQRLKLPGNLDGMAWRYANPAGANRRHHHAELELNLVTRGTGTYLLGNRHYRIRRGDLLWLFPAQEHVLIEQTPDFEMWIVVFRRRLIKRSATDPPSFPLLQRSFAGDTCRRLRQQDFIRSEALITQLTETANEAGLLNAGLAYVLLHAWKCFNRAGEVPVAFVTVHGEQAPDIDELREFLRGRLARFKVPKRIVVVEELPKTGTGKIQKFVLRDQLAAQTR